MTSIPTWHERAMAHPDHQSGMVSEAMIRARMCEEIEDLRAEIEKLTRELDEARAEVERLREQLNAAVTLLAEWCDAVNKGGASWDYWDDHYKQARWGKGILRSLIDAEIAKLEAKP